MIEAQAPHDDDQPGGELARAIRRKGAEALEVVFPEAVQDVRVPIHHVVVSRRDTARGVEDQLAVLSQELGPRRLPVLLPPGMAEAVKRVGGVVHETRVRSRLTVEKTRDVPVALLPLDTNEDWARRLFDLLAAVPLRITNPGSLGAELPILLRDHGARGAAPQARVRLRTSGDASSSLSPSGPLTTRSRLQHQGSDLAGRTPGVVPKAMGAGDLHTTRRAV
jgi:hypothetical protein